ncbi:hypothetical protein D7X48_12675 [bacterium D16-50]|nr:hypothetical protein D7X48_12675 [bacterium D16-50]
MKDMAKSWMEDKAIWVFDLAHNNLDEDAIVKGFLKHYVLQGEGIEKVQQDMHFRTHYGDLYLQSAISGLRKALEHQIDVPIRSEMRTLDDPCIAVKGGIAWEH